MTQAKPRFKNFEEYLTLESNEGLPEGRCEFVDGELIELPPESGLNDLIARYLLFVFASGGVVPLALIAIHTCEIEVAGKPRTRYPDFVILREEHFSLTQQRFTITLKMPPPRLVAEVISPGDENRGRDLVDKRKQYADRGIPEYWLIDRENHCITVLKLVHGQYIEHGVFRGDAQIDSPTFGLLSLTTDQILRSGR